MPRTIHAPETAELINGPESTLKVVTKETLAYERIVARMAKALGRKAVKVSRMRRALKRTEQELRDLRAEFKQFVRAAR